MSDEVVVTDASILLAQLLREPERSLVVAAGRRWLASGTRLVAPDHLWLEVTHPLVRRYGWSTEEVVEGLRELDILSIATIPTDRVTLLVATSLAETHRLSAYDAMYAAVAQVTGGRLATFDQQLRSAVPELLEPGFGEAPARRVNDDRLPYGTEPTGRATDLSPLGSYLGVLRRRALADAEAGRRR
jgi:predicted nucleic acid-binding protein